MAMTAQKADARPKNLGRNTFRKDFKRRRILYFMCIPGLLFYILFKYLPMYGIVVAFLDYNPYTGLAGLFNSEFVGLRWFTRMFQQTQFWNILRNTLLINVYMLIWAFPMPIILAILINEVRSSTYKRLAQSVTYLPHFLSWAIVSGFIFELLSTNNGLLNNVLMGLNLIDKPIQYIVEPKYFRTILVASSVWKEVGWDSIIYLAAIVGVDQALYEAATVDGASRFKQVFHITLPALLPVISVCMILNLGRLMSTGFDQIYMLMTPNTQKVGDVFSTFIYRVGIQNGQYSFTTAIGLFQNVVNCILVVTVNMITKRMTGNGIW